jgi:hypothetical protein
MVHYYTPQEMANILHIMAKKRYTTCLWQELERRAEAISGVFNSQAVANTLWAFVTMGAKPIEDDGAAGAAGGDDIRTLQTRCGRLRRWGQIRGSG